MNSTISTVLEFDSFPDFPTWEAAVLTHMQAEQCLIVNPRRKNGLILLKPFHAEFAGPGAAIGGVFDRNVQHLLPVGSLGLSYDEPEAERIKAYLIRRQWVRLTYQIVENSQPLERARTILNQFKHWFDAETALKLPPDILASLVGVLPTTILQVRDVLDD